MRAQLFWGLVAIMALVAEGTSFTGSCLPLDVRIREGTILATDADYLLNGTMRVVLTVLEDSTTWELFSTDYGLTWDWESCFRGDPGSPYDRFCFLAGAGDTAFYLYVFVRYEHEGLDHLDMVRTWIDPHRVQVGGFGDIIEPDTMGDFAFSRDYLSDNYWLFGCVTDSLTAGSYQALRFLRSTDFGLTWTVVDSFKDVISMPHLACGAGHHVYFTGRTGSGADSLIVWTNRDRLEPGLWLMNWIETGGDEIASPTVAASFNPDDSLATVWCAYSRNRNNSGNWDIEFVYSTDGGSNWSGPLPLAVSPDASERFFDLKSWRGPAGDEVSIAYICSAGSENVIYWRSARAGQPAVWSEPVRMNRMNAALGRNVRPRLCYLAGQAPVGVGVVYVAQDGSGCWWSAHYPGAQQEPEPAGRNGGSLLVTPRVGTGPFRIAGVEPGKSMTVVDRSGRVVRRLVSAESGTLWDGRDGDGRYLPSGAYLIRLSEGGAQSLVVLCR